MLKSNEKEKSFTFLDKDLNVISAINNSKFNPYLDIFCHYPENILLQNLGTLTGFFRINSFDEDSAYIVNFISSVLKKEYYINPKRNIESSFDSALRKVNLALSEIAKEGNINWLGKIDGVICALEKNNLHFSVCGKAKVLLIRNHFLTEISKSMALGDMEPNPLKTFVNVSSGRVEKEDKIIVCQDDVYKVFSEDELRKGSARFPREKFVQFLKTALVNKLEVVGAIVIDVFEKKEKIKPEIAEIPLENYNVFSKKSFEREKPPLKNLKDLLKEEEKKTYTDEKTGHIYIQEDEEKTKKENRLGIYWFLLKEKISDVYYWLKNGIRKKGVSIGGMLAQMKNGIIQKIKQQREESQRKKMEKLELEKSKKNEEKTVFLEEPETEGAKKNLEETVSGGKIKNWWLFLKKLAPNFGKIKSMFGSFSRKQKFYAIILIAMFFIIPFTFLKIQALEKTKKTSEQAQEKVPDERELLAQEKDIIFLSDSEKLFDVGNPKKLILLNERLVFLGENKIISREKNGEIKELSWPENYGAIKEAAPMEDLNLILVFTDQQKVISLFSVSPQFRENNIQIPENSEISGAGTYLTYLYLLDSAANQIYRYPRAEGGFGTRTDWLKEKINLSDSCCLAIDENIYLLNEGQLTKIFKGQKQELILKAPVNSFIPDRIFTNSQTENIYALGKESGRIIKYSKTGEILSQYFHEDIKKSADFAVDEKNNKAYLLTEQEIKSFNLQ